MRRLLKYTTLILMVLLISGSVWADTYTDHITTAPNNKGDVLIFPWYLAADGGWQTKLTVINTDEVNSVVAKLIIRSFKNSEELLDFFLYLSPADVWTGIIKYDSRLRKIVIFSNDDSALSSIVPNLVWANVTAINQQMYPVSCSGDGDYLGYVEVITAAAGPVPGAAPGVSKLSIYNAYAALVAGSASSLQFAGEYLQDHRINVLAGYMQIMNVVQGLDASLRATTLKDYGNLEAMTTGVETRLGAAGSAINNLAEIEAALTKDDIAMPYVNGDDLAIHIFTFPTKLTDIETCGSANPDSPYWTQNDLDRCIPYTLITYDLQEHFPRSGSPFSGGSEDSNEFCYEVNYVSAARFDYAEGWGHYRFDDTTTLINRHGNYLRYLGAPVLPTYFYIGVTGLSANYGAWTDELVFCSAGITTLIDYQYTDLASPACPVPTAPPA